MASSSVPFCCKTSFHNTSVARLCISVRQHNTVVTCTALWYEHTVQPSEQSLRQHFHRIHKTNKFAKFWKHWRNCERVWGGPPPLSSGYVTTPGDMTKLWVLYKGQWVTMYKPYCDMVMIRHCNVVCLVAVKYLILRLLKLTINYAINIFF